MILVCPLKRYYWYYCKTYTCTAAKLNPNVKRPYSIYEVVGHALGYQNNDIN